MLVPLLSLWLVLFLRPRHGLHLVAPNMQNFINSINGSVFEALESFVNLDDATSVFHFAALIESTFVNLRGLYEARPFLSSRRVELYSALAKYPVFHNNLLSVEKLNNDTACAERVIRLLENLQLSYSCHIRLNEDTRWTPETIPLIENMLHDPQNFDLHGGPEIHFASSGLFPLSKFLEAVGPRMSLDAAFSLTNLMGNPITKATIDAFINLNPYNWLLFVKMINGALITKESLQYEVDFEGNILAASFHLLEIFRDWIGLISYRPHLGQIEASFEHIPEKLIALLGPERTTEERQWISSALLETMLVLGEIVDSDGQYYRHCLQLAFASIHPNDVTPSLQETFRETFSRTLSEVASVNSKWDLSQSSHQQALQKKLEMFRLGKLRFSFEQSPYRHPIVALEGELFSILERLLSPSHWLLTINEPLPNPINTDSGMILYSYYDAALIYAELAIDILFDSLPDSDKRCWIPQKFLSDGVVSFINSIFVFAMLQKPLSVDIRSIFKKERFTLAPGVCPSPEPGLSKSFRRLLRTAFRHQIPLLSHFSPDEFLRLLSL